MAEPETIRRFHAKVEYKPNGCWQWTGAKSSRGYGYLRVDRRAVGAHRVAYELWIGSIPADKELDHLCRNRSCVNPLHLEPVTSKENAQRGETGKWQRDKTHCPAGHAYDDANTHLSVKGRYCRACRRIREAVRRALQRQAVTS